MRAAAGCAECSMGDRQSRCGRASAQGLWSADFAGVVATGSREGVHCGTFCTTSYRPNAAASGKACSPSPAGVIGQVIEAGCPRFTPQPITRGTSGGANFGEYRLTQDSDRRGDEFECGSNGHRVTDIFYGGGRRRRRHRTRRPRHGQTKKYKPAAGRASVACRSPLAGKLANEFRG